MNFDTIGLIVRIALYGVTGYFAGQAWLPPELVDLIRHPETVAVVTGLVAGAWYTLAKWRGWRT